MSKDKWLIVLIASNICLLIAMLFFLSWHEWLNAGAQISSLAPFHAEELSEQEPIQFVQNESRISFQDIKNGSMTHVIHHKQENVTQIEQQSLLSERNSARYDMITFHSAQSKLKHGANYSKSLKLISMIT